MATTTMICLSAAVLVVAIASGLAVHHLVGVRPSKAGPESEVGS